MSDTLERVRQQADEVRQLMHDLVGRMMDESPEPEPRSDQDGGAPIDIDLRDPTIPPPSSNLGSGSPH